MTNNAVEKVDTNNLTILNAAKELKKREENSILAVDCLKKALLELMKEKSYKELSISELCRKAGVSRMAFYRKYQQINELFYDTAVDMNTQVIKVCGSPFRDTTANEWYIKAFKTIYEHKDELAIMYQENFQFEWMKVVNSLAVHDQKFTAETKYQRLAWCGAFENIISAWINSGCKESPEEMADYCIKYLPSTTI